MNFKEIEKLIVSKGWYYHHTNGSHYIYKNNNINGIVILPRHKGDIPKGTLNSIMRQAGLK